MADLDDDALISIMMSTRNSETCEITALTVPTPLNQQRAVSMYSADDARTQNLPYNRYETCNSRDASCDGIAGRMRARHLRRAIQRGHDRPAGAYAATSSWDVVMTTRMRTYGNVSISPSRMRIHARDGATWHDGRGGGESGGREAAAAGPILSGLMNQNAVIANGGANDGGGFREGKADGYTWSQNDEEVELRFPISVGTKAKYVKINFGTNKLRVVVAGQTLASGSLGGTVEVDDCTFTIEDANGGTGKELCVTLGKKEGYTWPFVIRDT
ncbi:hypothetical protein ACHAXA_008452 [Cyclostephanos tholiformis]|uniref:CS domain-containing protein n=1 Tax=Cyclostephanos tholiformis TaxID=382380 RepID=A0ABD3SBA4_9STRA